MRENACCMVFHARWIFHHSSPNPTLVSLRRWWDSATCGEKNPSHMENHTKSISSYRVKGHTVGLRVPTIGQTVLRQIIRPRIIIIRWRGRKRGAIFPGRWNLHRLLKIAIETHARHSRELGIILVEFKAEPRFFKYVYHNCASLFNNIYEKLRYQRYMF